MFFDTAARQTCIVKPTRTNTPLHALTTLNDVTYVEAARALAQRVLTAGRPSRRRSASTWPSAWSSRRRPTRRRRRQVLLAGLARLRREFARRSRRPRRSCSAVGESKRDEKLDAVEHAAYTALCSAILNLDEALTKE